MKLSKLVIPSLLPSLLYFVFCFAASVIPAKGQEFPGRTLLTNCKPGGAVRAYKNPGAAIKAYAHLACGSSVYVWNATPKFALVQQGATVAYVSSKNLSSEGTSTEASPAVLRVFLQSIADTSQSSDDSALAVRRHLVESCLATRGCQVEAWSNLAWTRINRASDLADSPESTLRLYAGGLYYSALLVNPEVRFKDSPLPGLDSPVLLLDGGGLSMAVADHTCYALETSGKWAAAGASAGEPTAAIH